jgi:hypothetical protein
VTETKHKPINAKAVQEHIAATKARIDELETWDLEALLIELGRLVTVYQVWTSPVILEETKEPHPETPFCFWIEYAIDMGHYTFECSGTWPNADGEGRTRATSLQKAVLYALGGAVAMLGPDA